MKGLGRKASFLAIMAVIATAMMGAGYTLWYEDLELNANVSTGELDGWIYCGTAVSDNEPGTDGTSTIPGYPNPGKDVGIVDSAGNVDPPGPDGETDHAFLIEISNAYPGYAFDCEIHLANTGTVPWHIEDIQMVVTDQDGNVVDLLQDLNCSGGTCTAGQVDSPANAQGQVWTDPNDDPIRVVFGNILGCQVHFDQDSFGKATSIRIGVNQSALEGTTYKIWLKFQVNQWNESGWAPAEDGQCGQKVGDPVLPPL